MADEFGALLETNSGLVRKWGRALLAIQDHSEPVPDEFFTAEGIPIIPASAKQLGFITTDGVTAAQSISATATNMMQTLAPVRNDLESITRTLACAFGEGSNAYVQAVNNGVKVEDFPATPDGDFAFDSAGGEYPEYRVFLIATDGERFRVEYAPKAKVSATTDRTLSRANPETLGFTFDLLWDTEEDTDYRKMERTKVITPGP